MKYIPIARPEMPGFGSFAKEARRIWASRLLSNFGPYAERLEQISRGYTRARHAAAVVSCDVGLMIVMRALKLPPGSHAIVPSFTFASTVNAVAWNGLRPVFGDITPDTFCLDPEDVSELITPKTSLIVATHIYGRPADVRTLQEVADDKGLPLLFDAAHAYGSSLGKRRVGTFGTAEVFSLSGTKVVTSGEGGLITTGDRGLDKRIRFVRGYGFIGDYNPRFVGINGKIAELNAALGCLTLPSVDEAVARRERLAQRYRSRLGSVKGIKFQRMGDGVQSTHKDFGILVSGRRDKLKAHLQERGVQTKAYFRPLHTSKAYRPFSNRRLPVTDAVARRILCIPILTSLTGAEQNHIVRCISEFFDA